MEYEFGWNDPPTYSYSSSQAVASKQTRLNKRPHHQPPTLIANSNPGNKPLPLSEPIPTLDLSSGPPIGPPIGNRKEDTIEKPADDEINLSSEQSDFDFTDVILKLNSLTDSLRDKLQGRVYDDIKRRLGLLSKQFEDGKLSAPVQSKVGKLVTAMEKGEYNVADSMQVAMMVDHVSEVSQWLVGVKRLIAVLKSESQ